MSHCSSGRPTSIRSRIQQFGSSGPDRKCAVHSLESKGLAQRMQKETEPVRVGLRKGRILGAANVGSLHAAPPSALVIEDQQRQCVEEVQEEMAGGAKGDGRVQGPVGQLDELVLGLRGRCSSSGCRRAYSSHSRPVCRESSRPTGLDAVDGSFRTSRPDFTATYPDLTASSHDSRGVVSSSPSRYPAPHPVLVVYALNI
ncbi:hypothetical protein LIER_23016 [Lithospermum erythrorhizon]|uniref:Uncharacterized protein n=1 Tax=Lithospermum erythrorhizon TaxID=34254 RepID=A0AAV3QVX2_LITER